MKVKERRETTVVETCASGAARDEKRIRVPGTARDRHIQKREETEIVIDRNRYGEWRRRCKVG